jgi:hypothetical protein
VDTIVEYKDFSRQSKQIKFTVGAQEYDAVPALGLGLAVEMSNIGKTFAGGEGLERVDTLWEFFGGILQDDGADRLKKQAYSKIDPLDIRQLMNIMNWLLEVYGLRPTQPSNDSSTGSSDDGKSSTDGAQPEESILETSSSLAS